MSEWGGAGTAPTAFCCLSSSLSFLGAVGMINSLRLHGHGEPIHLLDARNGDLGHLGDGEGDRRGPAMSE